jgi:myo-inositol catabolism protein IolC
VKQLYILPFDHQGTFQTTMLGWGKLTAAQTAEIAAAKQVIYDGFKATIAAGVLKDKAGILGSTVFWEPLVKSRAKKITREAAVAEIGHRYQEFVDIFENARAFGNAHAS